jgi:RNA-directed DNA polymerase
MAHQQSADRRGPQGRRKASRTRRGARGGGGQAVPVNQPTAQLGRRFGTAENAAAPAAGADGSAARPRSRAAPDAAPTPTRTAPPAPSAPMEDVTQRLRAACAQGASQRGAPGPDRQTLAQVREPLAARWPPRHTALLEGTDAPGTIRRVGIPQAGGGQRGGGLPTVGDRRVAAAVRVVLAPRDAPTFPGSRHGLRPGRRRQTAIAAAQQQVEAGDEGGVALDVAHCFQRIHPQR